MSQLQTRLVSTEDAYIEVLAAVHSAALAGQINQRGVAPVACASIRAAVEKAIPRASGVSQEVLDGLLATEQWLQGWASAEPYLRRVRKSIARARAQHQATLEIGFSFEDQLFITVHGTEQNLNGLLSAIGCWQRAARPGIARRSESGVQRRVRRLGG